MLALAQKKCESATNWSREKVESELEFVGFITFKCLTRADSKLVISALKVSAHAVGMLTGDGALTALHVEENLQPKSLSRIPFELCLGT